MAVVDDTQGKHSSDELVATDGRAQPSPSGKPRQRTLRFRLASLVLACVLPVCAIAGFVVFHAYQQKRNLLEQRVLETAKALSTVVDRELAAMQASASALATSPSLVPGDLAAFHRQAQAVLRDYPGATFTLADATGQQLVNTSAPFGTPLPKRTKLELVERVFGTGKPLVVNLFKGNLLATPIVGVEVPVIRDGRVVYDLALVLPAKHFDALLSQQSVPPEWITAIEDGNRVLVARNQLPERYVGLIATPDIVRRTSETYEGVVETINRENIAILAMFSRSTITDWSVIIAIPKAVILADIYRWLWWTVAGGLLLSITGIALALFLAHRIGGSIGALVAPALALGAGGTVSIGQLDLAETNAVGQSLVKASQLLQQRTAEREQAEQALRENEEKFRRLVDQTKDHAIFMLDPQGRVVSWNSGAQLIKGYTESEIIGRHISCFYVPADVEQDRPEQLLQAAAEHGLAEDVGWRVRKDGSRFWAEVTLSVLRDDSGHIRGFSKITRDITEYRKAEQRIAHLASFPELNANPILEIDLQGKVTYGNHAAKTRFPDIAEIGTKHPLLKKWSSVTAALGTDVQQQVVTHEIEADGAVFHQTFHYLPDAGSVRVYFADITERKRAEEQLQKHNRTLRALSNSNQALMHATDESVFLQQVCRIITEDCGHAMVWIGFAENDENKTVRPVAHAGFDEGYLEAMRITWADSERGRGPTGTAIRTGQPSMCRNMLTDPAFLPWREQAIKRGYASSLVIPLKEGNKVFGAITIYSRETNTFTEGEVSLLTELAADLAYGIGTLRMRAAKAKAEEERATTVEFLRLVNQSQGTRDLIQAATTFFQQRSTCQAVGIRLQEGDDYPYYEARGFPKEFVQLENSLCSRDAAGKVIRDSSGKPAIECMCGNVICGRVDPSKPFFTANGSFWANDTTRLLAITADADRQTRTRNRCNGEGYESVALIPLCVGRERLGLLQLNDRQKGRFSLESIHLWERLADYLAVALSKFRAEEALRESEAQFRELAEGIPQLAWTANADGWIYWYNQRWYEYTGTSPEQMEGWGWQSVHDPEALPKVLERWKGSISTGKPFDMVVPLRGADGKFRPFLTRVMPLRDTHGQVVRWFGTNTDISEQRRLQESLRASEERWATTLRSIGDAVIATDASGRVTFMNDVAEKLTGWPLSEAQGRDLNEVFKILNEVTRIMSENPVAKVLRMGQVVGLANHTALISRNGTELPIEDSGAPIRDKEGKTIGVVLVFHDTSEKRRAEKALRDSERLATTGRLASTLAHEIHNPLDTVGSLLYLIDRNPDMPEEARQHIAMASEELDRVTQMTRHMLSFQREAKKPVPIKIDEILDNVITLYGRKIEANGIRIEKQVEFEGEFIGLPGELRQVFANLVGNAIEAIGQNGKIKLHAYASQDWRRGQRGLRVAVADNGPGIPDEIRDKILDPFFTTKGESGTGLGLWITSGIIQKNDGILRLRSVTRDGRSGTCFSIFFPFPA